VDSSKRVFAATVVEPWVTLPWLVPTLVMPEPKLQLVVYNQGKTI